MRNLILAGAVGLALGAAAPALSSPAAAAEAYALDMAHSAIVFEVNHLGLSNTIGRFNEAEGVVMIDQANPANSKVEVTIQAASIDTNHDARDGHLRGADFFNVEAHPTITFASTAVELTGDNTAKVTGDFTMLGVTKPVTLDVTLNALKAHPIPNYNGVMVAGFSGSTTIKRSEYGMGAYVPAVGDEVEIVLQVEALQR